MLTNLLDNALRHAPEGGQIEVRLRATADSVEVCVADDGPGSPGAAYQLRHRRGVATTADHC